MMDAYVLDRSYNQLAVIDVYASFIWTERFREIGDFELYLPFSAISYSALKKDNYIYIKDSETYMVIETVEVNASSSEGPMTTVTGRCLKSILDRRIVWDMTVLNGNLQDAVEKILNENVINPSDTRRKIPNVKFTRSTDPRITAMQTDTVWHGEMISDVIRLLCAYHSIGWKAIPYGEGGIEIQLFAGQDRSYEQEDNFWVVFSKGYENLLSSHYYESTRDTKTVCRIADSSSMDGSILSATAYDQNGGGSGLDRRESFIESYAPTTDEDTGEELTDAQRAEYLISQGQKELSEAGDNVYVEGEIDAQRQYLYGRDFFMGDIVQVDTDFGIGMQCRVMEVIRSQDDSKGYKITPTFETV